MAVFILVCSVFLGQHKFVFRSRFLVRIAYWTRTRRSVPTLEVGLPDASCNTKYDEHVLYAAQIRPPLATSSTSSPIGRLAQHCGLIWKAVLCLTSIGLFQPAASRTKICSDLALDAKDKTCSGSKTNMYVYNIRYTWSKRRTLDDLQHGSPVSKST
jgi:hypothetical protein